MDSPELLERLIGFDTVSHRANSALIDYVADYLDDLGVASRRIGGDEPGKTNLFATIGPADVPGVILSGHTDVVPTEGQDWSSDPFVAERRDGRIYGRGSADMKGYLACMLAAVPYFLRCDLKRPVHLAFSYDEEVGCLGIRPLLESLADCPVRPAACIIGEPTGLQPVLDHKGKFDVRCHVRGASCHSAHAPDGVNAIEYAARIIERLGMIRDRLMQPAHRDPRFEPPFSTIQTGLIQGGRALNIVPEDCVFDWECRALPGLDAAELRDELIAYVDAELVPAMQRVSPQAGVAFETRLAVPGLHTDPGAGIARLMSVLTGRDDRGTVAFGTEAGLYDAAHIPTVVCGPGHMAQGHRADEYIELSELHGCDAMMQRLADWLAAPDDTL